MRFIGLFPEAPGKLSFKFWQNAVLKNGELLVRGGVDAEGDAQLPEAALHFHGHGVSVAADIKIKI